MSNKAAFTQKNYSDEARDSLLVVLDQAINEEDKANAYIQLSKVYFTKDLNACADYAQKALDLFEAIDDKEGVVMGHNQIGIASLRKGQVNEGLRHFNTALEIGLKDENISPSLVSSLYNNLGNTYLRLQEFRKAEKSFRKVIQFNKENNISNADGQAYNNLGIVYKYLEKLDSSLESYSIAIEMWHLSGNQVGLIETYNNMSSMYAQNGNTAQAKEYLHSALKISKEINHYHGLAATYGNLANLYEMDGEIDSCLYYARLGVQNARTVGSRGLLKNIMPSVYDALYRLGNYKEAFDEFDAYIALRDSLDEESDHEELTKLESEHELEKKELENKRLEEVNAKAKLEKEKKHIENQILIGGGIVLLLIVVLIAIGFIRKRRDHILISGQKEILNDQKTILEIKNAEILDSINYAKRIQSAILPQDETFKEHLPNSFVMYEPKDIVAGDFYWLEQKADTVLFAAADCTGHGVPGAMVSVVCNNGLNRAVREHGLTNPGQILDKTREIVIEEFSKSSDDVKDGMDIALCSLEGNTLKYAGANNPLWVIREGSDEVEEFKADKQPIGMFDHPKPYTSHQIELQKGDQFYIFSDGYPDQFGGEGSRPGGKKFKASNFKKLLVANCKLPMDEQLAALRKHFSSWKGDLEQLDDVCVIGVRV